MTAPANHSFPERRGVCPGLSRPLPTGDGLLLRLITIGTIPLDAFAALCAAARRHGNGIIEITARGSVQIRGLNAGSASKFADEIATLGIAAEDGVPVLCNPLAGLDAEEIFDASMLAAALRGALARRSLAERLDPKVSVIIDGGGPFNLARVAADFRLSAQLVNGTPALHIGVGGDAASAIDLGLIAPEYALEAVLRLLSVLAQRGSSVRASDVIAAEGAIPFHDALASARAASATQFDPDGATNLNLSSASSQSKDAIGLHQLRDGSLACGIGLAFGHAEASLLEKVAGAAAAAGARGLRTAPNRALLAIGLTPQDAATFFAAADQLGFVTRAGDPRRHVHCLRRRTVMRLRLYRRTRFSAAHRRRCGAISRRRIDAPHFRLRQRLRPCRRRVSHCGRHGRSLRFNRQWLRARRAIRGGDGRRVACCRRAIFA